MLIPGKFNSQVSCLYWDSIKGLDTQNGDFDSSLILEKNVISIWILKIVTALVINQLHDMSQK